MRLPLLTKEIASPLSLFDYDTGIMVMGRHYDPSNPDYSGNYYQKGREWERLSNVEFYELKFPQSR